MNKRKKENKLTIILFIVLAILIIVIFNRTALKLENKVEKVKYTHHKYKPIKMQIEEEINPRKTKKSKNENERIYLDERYQEEVAPSARHPFMPPTAAPGVEAPRAIMPIARIPEAEKARPMLPTQIEPLPGQAEEKIEVPEVPTWPTESPVLAAGPPQRLKFLLHLTVTGIAGYGNKRFAIIEEKVTQQPGGGRETRSYIVKEGSVITEYRLKVKKIGRNEVKLQRGNQIVELPLVDRPETLPLPLAEARPVYGTKPGSEVRYKGVEGE